jgi:D-alanyl-D-alanine carboxypeptidase/D-alanyl-D-alanine-endopeptidase (penicillin-binding protein 4)
MVAVGILAISALALYPNYIKARLNLERMAALIASDRAAGPDAATRTAPPEPSFDVASWYAGRGEAPEVHGVLIETLDGQRSFASHNADLAFNPASLVKLATSLVALKKLGADYRFQTRVFADGEVDKKGVLQGRLYVSGNDPTFGDPGASLLSRELRERGIERLTEVVVSPEFCFNFSDKPEESAERLARALKLGNPKTEVADETGGQSLLVVNSNRLSDVLLYMNARSSNFIAEKLGAQIGGAEGVRRFLVDELKLPSEQVMIERVSGREHNRMTPRGLLAVIRALIEEAKRQGLEPPDLLPVASDDAGTLRRRLGGTGLEGAVVGKTGTLTAEVDGGMASLAGIVYTRDAGIVLFAILDQGNRIGENRQLEDELLTEVITAEAVPQPIASPTPRRLLPASGVQIQKPQIVNRQ